MAARPDVYHPRTVNEDLPLVPEASSEAAPPRDGGSPSALDARVLCAFLEDGRLVSIPAQAKKRLVVLRYLATTVFEPGRRYAEKEVNQRLALLHPDVASLRRYLVEAGFMRREASVYELRPREAWPLS